MNLNNRERTMVHLRHDLLSRIDERLQRLNALGLKCKRDSFIEVSVNYIFGSPEKRGLAVEGIRELRLNNPEAIPAHVGDRDLLLNYALEKYLAYLEAN